jgi:phosphate transport system substrate-binding protein
MLRYRNVIRKSFVLSFILVACQTSTQQEIPNTPTTGKISIWADKTFQYILPPQIDLFSSIYKNTEVGYRFAGEQECIEALLKDSCKVIFINRMLSTQEQKTFEAHNLIIQQTAVARSAIAILSTSLYKQGMSIDELVQILKGEKNYPIVFFGKNNGTVLYCKDTLLKGADFGKNCFSIEDSAEFRKQILEHKEVIGIIDFAFICDDDDKWIRSLKYPQGDTLLIPIRKNSQSPAYYPDQSNIATTDYPLTRTIYCIRRGDDFSLSAGIEAFVAGEKGQVLFKKMGLVPIIDRPRQIEMKPY